MSLTARTVLRAWCGLLGCLAILLLILAVLGAVNNQSIASAIAIAIAIDNGVTAIVGIELAIGS